MALLHHISAKCSVVELDLISALMTELSINEKLYTKVLPLSDITDSGLIEFFISRDGEKYLDLNDTLLHLHMKITKADRMMDGVRGFF